MNRSAPARHTDPDTSKAAAESVEGDRASFLENAVLRAIRYLGSAHSEEVANHLGIDLQSISPRFKPLETRGLIVRLRKPDGSLVRRPGSSTRSRQVWILADQATPVRERKRPPGVDPAEWARYLASLDVS